MTSDHKIVFISNPASGTSNKKPDETFIRSFFENDSTTEIEIIETKFRGHAVEIAAEAVKKNADVVVAIGGDGTVNEIAGSLVGSNCALGIIPCGSGNGLARHHKIPMNFSEALRVIKRNNQKKHDAARINKVYSFNVSGLGYDAHVAHLFGKDGKRGFNSYIKLVFREFAAYHEHMLKITNGSEIIRQPVLLAAIATASQFGNNATISPLSDTNDGMTNLTLVRKMSGWKMPWFVIRVFAKQVGKSKFAKLLQQEKFIIESEIELPLHVDGEPAGFHKRIEIETVKDALRIIVP